MKRALRVCLVVFLVTEVSIVLAAPVDKEIPYKKITALAPGTYKFRFSLWNDEMSTDPSNMVWSEEKKITLTSSTVKTFLGDTFSLDDADFSEQLWVQVDRVKAGPTYIMIGRRDKLGVSPYALSSERTNSVGSAALSSEILVAICGIYYATNTAPPDMCRNLNLIFTTSATYTGDLGGLAGADAKCQALAEAAGLPGTFKAWLSDSSTTASQRLSHSAMPYIRTDGRHIAKNWADLTDGTIDVPLSVDENGSTIESAWPYTWTWTNADGSGGTTGWNCRDWTYSGGLPDKGEGGFIYETNYKWTMIRSSDGCGESLYLYCIEQ
jgi:hypothetical protein